MMRKPPTAPLAIRPAHEADRPALESIAARTWDGEDYLARVITDWLADPVGVFLVAELEGRAVGTIKLTLLGPGEWWMEGIRVDPDLYGRGIASALHQYTVEQAILRGGETLRFCTDLENTPIHQIARKTGFREAARFLRYLANAYPDQRGADQFRALGENDHSAAWAYLAGSPHYPEVDRSTIGRRWKCERITPDRLRDYLRSGWVYGWHGQRRDAALLDGLVVARKLPSAQQPDVLTVLYLDAMPGALATLAQAARGLAAQTDCVSLWHMAYARPDRLVAIEQAGWRRPEDNGGRAVLFARTLNGSI